MESPEFQTPSPLQKVPLTALNERGITLYVKRDDLIHSDISGNKWRKLKYNIAQAQHRGAESLLTFGGAHSNHIAATAAAAAKYGFRSHGIIRGEDADLDNPTLRFAQDQGMEMHLVSRTEFRESENYGYIQTLRERFGGFYLIPQGGANHYGVQGAMETIKEIDLPAHRIFVGVGTGTTLSGLVLGNQMRAEIYGVSALKGGDFLQKTVEGNLKSVLNDTETEAYLMEKAHFILDHHFGGYARMKPELLEFMRSFFRETGIKTDPVYTAKAAYAMVAMAQNAPPTKPENWILIHTGGLQGIPAMEQKIGETIYPIVESTSNCE